MTLIEQEAYDHLASIELELPTNALRRNLLTSGIQLSALVGRGGLRAQILDGGLISVGDAVSTMSETAPSGRP